MSIFVQRRNVEKTVKRIKMKDFISVENFAILITNRKMGINKEIRSHHIINEG